MCPCLCALPQHIDQVMSTTGGTLTRKRLAFLEQDVSNGSVQFTFEEGISNEDVYPGEYTQHCSIHCILLRWYLFFFTDGGAPPDGTPNQIRHTFMIGLVVWFDILAASGILFTVACLVFNIVFRNRR